MRKLIANIFLFLASILLMIFVSEIALRIALPVGRKRSRYMSSRNIFHYDARNIRFDEDLGYMMKPDLKTVFSNLEFRTEVLANSFGARDDENSLENPDIILLGDSFAFGCGVEKDQTCESFLEKLCHVAVLNLGLSGYGTVQEFLILKRWAAQHKQLKNKLIVFLFYSNDLSENLGYGFDNYPTVYTENGVTRFSKCTRDGYDRWLKACNESMSRGLNKHSYFVSEWRSFIK